MAETAFLHIHAEEGTTDQQETAEEGKERQDRRGTNARGGELDQGHAKEIGIGVQEADRIGKEETGSALKRCAGGAGN